MRIGVDLGGTKIEVVAIDDDDHILLRQRRATPVGDYPATLECIAALVEEARALTGKGATIGIATPGSISSRTGLLRNSNSTALNGKPLHQDLNERLAQEVRLENDANCFALSEAVDGAAARHAVVFGVILGTGVGGGIVIDRRVLRGRNGIAGEWGHNPMPWARPQDGPAARCYCGKSGCIETYLSGPALTRLFAARTGRALSALEVAAAAHGGDQEALACMRQYVDLLARALASVLDVLDPDVVVLGGGLSNIDWLYDEVPPRLAEHAFSDGIDTPVLRAKHGDSGGVRGAAWLWPKQPP